MKKPPNGTEHSKDFAVEIGTSWRRWARRRTDEELLEVKQRCAQLAAAFGASHRHSGLGLRALREGHFEFRISKGLRVIFLLIRPRTLRLMMIGNHDDVRTWIKENL
jgi:hypothetical protein